MATGGRRRRRHRSDKKKPKRKRASTKKQPPAPAAGPTSMDDVPDSLLELILLHLDSSASLLRAAAACKRWRRIVVAAGFLSRRHSLHGHGHDARPVAGHYHAFDPDWIDYDSPPVTDNPVFVPSPSLAVDGRRFSLDFLPDSDSGWALADSRGSLLLLFKRRTGWAALAQSRGFPDLLVCEPLTRRCQGILRPPEHPMCLGVFLLDGDRDDASGGRVGGMSGFRVVSVLHEYHPSEDGRGMPAACVFTSGSDGGWRVLADGASTANGSAISLPGPGAIDSISFAGRVNGSLYWVTGEDDGAIAMLVFDEAAMKFSKVPFLTENTGGPRDRWSFRVIGGEDGALRVVRLVSNELMVLVQQHEGGDGEWVVEKLVRLPEATLALEGRMDRFFQRNAMIVAAHEAFVLVTPHEKTWLFSVELETLRVEREHERNKFAGAAFPSRLPWPPSLTACAERGRRRKPRRLYVLPC